MPFLNTRNTKPARTAPPARARNRRPAGPPSRPARPRRAWYLPAKTVVEYLAALALAVPAVPVIVAAALLVKLTSRGPAFYTQTRVGRGGRTFTIYKLRTMVDKCESLTGPRWSMPGDPRITRLGHLLRKMHLDELPQLFNVLRGEMGLIGPRPERPEFFPELERAVPRYRERLAVLPGVTGLAQVQLPADTDVDNVRRKLAFDLHYIEHLGPLLDLRILFCTALYAAGVPVRLVRRCLGRAALPGGESAATTEVAARVRLSA